MTSPLLTRKRNMRQNCSRRPGQNSVMQTRHLLHSEPSVEPLKSTSRKRNTTSAPCCASSGQRSALTRHLERPHSRIPHLAQQPPVPRLALSSPRPRLEIQAPHFFILLTCLIGMEFTSTKTPAIGFAKFLLREPKRPPQTTSTTRIPASPPAHTPLLPGTAPSAAPTLLTGPHHRPPQSAAPLVPNLQPTALAENVGPPPAPPGPASGTHKSGQKAPCLTH